MYDKEIPLMHTKESLTYTTKISFGSTQYYEIKFQNDAIELEDDWFGIWDEP